MIIRIIYFFSFKNKETYDNYKALKSSRYYSLLNDIFKIVFNKSGVLSVLRTADSKVKELVLAFYNTVVQNSTISEVSTAFSVNSLNLKNFYIQKAILNFSNKFYNSLTISKVLYLDNVTVFQYLSTNFTPVFLSLFDKFLADIS